jgi:hypothetical protein
MTHVPVVLGLFLGLVLTMPVPCAPHMVNAPAHAAGPVAVFLQFDNPIPELALQQMQREVFSILRPAGYDFVWLLLTRDLQMGQYSDLVVVHFTGDCDASRGRFFPRVGALKGEPLARTAVSDGVVLPFTEVRCDQMRQFLGVEMSGRKDKDNAATMGRALGRVLSHEMFHMLAGTRSHARSGVARPAHSVQELASEKAFQFEPEEIRLLHGIRKRSSED